MTTVAETVPATAGVNARGRSEHSERFYRPELDVLRFFAFLLLNALPAIIIRHRFFVSIFFREPTACCDPASERNKEISTLCTAKF